MVTNPCHFVDFPSEEMEMGAQIEVIYVDFQKSFVKVDHNIPLKKLVNIKFFIGLTE